MEINQRVYIKSENAYGYFVGTKDEYRRVTLDGNDVSDPYNAEDVVPVETVVLDGVVSKVYLSGTFITSGNGTHSLDGALNAGETLRITIERRKEDNHAGR